MEVLQDGRIMIWRLDRPDAGNGLDEPTMTSMVAALDQLTSAPDEFGCLLIQGRETVFSTGLDEELLKICFQDRAQFAAVTERLAAIYERIVALPQVVIACIEGECRLGGLELALACDLIIAAEDAQITDGHLAYDAMPGGGATKRLPARLGYAKALQFLLESPLLSGAEAAKMGLVDIVVPIAEAKDRSLQLANRLTERDPNLIAALKTGLRAAAPADPDMSFLDAFREVVINRLVPAR